jgi:hypothetical protein
MLVIYERFIEIRPIEEEIDLLEISAEEKDHLHFMVAEILHHHTLDVILEQLEEEDKKAFLKRVEESNEMNLVSFLKEKLGDYEDSLKNRLHQVRDDLVKEIKKVKDA